MSFGLIFLSLLLVVHCMKNMWVWCHSSLYLAILTYINELLVSEFYLIFLAVCVCIYIYMILYYIKGFWINSIRQVSIIWSSIIVTIPPTKLCGNTHTHTHTHTVVLSNFGKPLSALQPRAVPGALKLFHRGLWAGNDVHGPKMTIYGRAPWRQQERPRIPCVNAQTQEALFNKPPPENSWLLYNQCTLTSSSLFIKTFLLFMFSECFVGELLRGTARNKSYITVWNRDINNTNEQATH